MVPRKLLCSNFFMVKRYSAFALISIIKLITLCISRALNFPALNGYMLKIFAYKYTCRKNLISLNLYPGFCYKSCRYYCIYVFYVEFVNLVTANVFGRICKTG